MKAYRGILPPWTGVAQWAGHGIAHKENVESCVVQTTWVRALFEGVLFVSILQPVLDSSDSWQEGSTASWNMLTK